MVYCPVLVVVVLWLIDNLARVMPQFMSYIAHRVKTIMTTFVCYCQSLIYWLHAQRGKTSSLSPSVRQYSQLMNYWISSVVSQSLQNVRGHLQGSWCLSTWSLLATESPLEPPCLHLKSTLLWLQLSYMNEHALPYTSREMWQYLDHVATFLTETGKVLRTIPSSEKGLVRQGLLSRYNNSFTSKKRNSTPQTKNKAIPFITGENGQLLPGK